jgi:2-methylcitrate dehydratase PrpD
MLGGRLNFHETDSAIPRADPVFRRLRESISVAGDPEFDRQGHAARGAIVEIVTSAGVSHIQRIEHPRGHTLREEVQWANLYDKWAELLEPRLGQGGFAQFQRLMSSLDAVQDVAELTRLLQRWSAADHVPNRPRTRVRKAT